MDKKEKMYQRMQDNASEQDVKKIAAKLSGMNRGKIAKIWDQVMALWKFIQDPEAPWGGKAIAIGALVYLISPIDAVPDLIPGFGLLDDASIIALAVGTLANDLKKYLSKNE